MPSLRYLAIFYALLTCASSVLMSSLVTSTENKPTDLSALKSLLKNNSDPTELLQNSRFLNYLDEINPNQIIIFNIGDTNALQRISSSHKQSFKQDTINYCNFDPSLLSNNNSRKLTNFRSSDDEQPLKQQLDPKSSSAAVSSDNLNVNIFLKGDVYNETSQVTGI